MIWDRGLIVAKLRYPMRVDGIDKVVRGLERMYPGDKLVIITDGPLWEDGWMLIARPPERTDDLSSEGT